MTREDAVKLQARIAFAAGRLSAERPSNVRQETFTAERVCVLTDLTAVVVFAKSQLPDPTPRKRVFVWFYLDELGEWRYLIAKPAHILGMSSPRMRALYEAVEEGNYEHNFT